MSHVKDDTSPGNPPPVTLGAGLPAFVVFGEGALASTGATVISNPFEVMKTRLQLQGELMKQGSYHKKYDGMLSGMVKVASQEGVLALQKGLWASMIHQVVQNGLRLGSYPHFKTFYESLNGGEANFGISVISGSSAGLVGAISSNPLMLVKTRLQSSSTPRVGGKAANPHQPSIVGYQHHYKGVWDGLRTVVREDGVKGLWFGVKPAMYRTVVGSGTQLSTYDAVKVFASEKLELPDTDVRVHIIASGVASCAVVIGMNPLDVILTRSYNNGKSHIKAKSASVPGIMREIVAVEGVQGLYKGSFALWSRLAPHFICTFVFLEQLRKVRPAIWGLERAAG